MSEEGVFSLESTVRYGQDFNVVPYNSHFRPHRLGPHQVTRVDITEHDVLVVTTGGTVRLPRNQVSYSYIPE